ncbi:MAG TPA: tRNA lysidine(34) synthetase TilS, partial [Chloroflexi bacterium]|nr:tRNA lysidine(34) synthetase TilS [Chloroflexota bacterium]
MANRGLQLLGKIRRLVAEYRLFSSGEKVIVGVSGGPDSLCLLHVLNRLKDEWGISLHVAHLHHQIRGADADEDASFVERIAKEWGLPITLEARDVPALARKEGMGIEEAARYARYQFLAEVALREGARTIAVGHNADDQVETVVMHWLRGSGLAGLRGMLPRTRLVVGGKEYDLWLVRPLLGVTRAEIEAYCREHGLQPRFDLSNLDTTYFRNLLRHELIPYLESFNPRFKELVRRSARLFADDYDFLHQQLEAVWPQVVESEEDEGIVFSLPRWRELHPSMQRAVLREAVRRMRRGLRDINWIHIEDARRALLTKGAGTKVTLPQGLLLTIGYGIFFIGEEGFTPQEDVPLLEGYELPLETPGVTKLPGTRWTVEVRILRRTELPSEWRTNPDPWQAFLDEDKITGP